MAQDCVRRSGKLFVKDNTETPDTLQVTYLYPSGFVATSERRSGNGQSMFEKGGGILFCGNKGTMFLDRGGYKIVPEMRLKEPREMVNGRAVREPATAEADVKSSDSRECESLGELPGVRADAAEADQRYRHVPAVDFDVPVGERGAAEQVKARLGCEEVGDGAAVGGGRRWVVGPAVTQNLR